MPTSESTSAAGTVAGWAAGLLRVRWFVRAPIWLYRARLGFLFGPRLVMLEHIGRTTGARRYVVLEVVDHPQADTYMVVSGFGDRAQWFRNVRAEPHVRVYAGGHAPVPATARLVTAEQGAATLTSYAAQHPRAWAGLKPVLESTLGTRLDALPMVALELDRT